MTRAIVIVFSIVGSASGATLYVDDDGLVEGDGTSWDTAYKFLQDALEDARNDPLVTEIRVAGGEYRAHHFQWDQNGTWNREDSFEPVDDVPIRGSFAGFGADDPDAQSIELHPTILTGDLQGNDEYGGFSENTRHVVRTQETGQYEIESVVIRSGYATASTIQDGAGVLHESGSLLLQDVSIVQCHAGDDGGAVFTQAHLTMNGCTLSQNEASSTGGAVFMQTGTLHLAGCDIQGNSAGQSAGAIWNNNGTGTMDSCSFIENTAPWAGALLIRHPFLITNCSFERNSSGACILDDADAVLQGCAFTAHTGAELGGAVRLDKGVIRDCAFSANHASYGGAVYCLDGSIAESVFEGNTAAGEGGAVYCDGHDVSIEGCDFVANSAVFGGGAIMQQEAGGTISQCTFTNNTASELAGRGGAIAQRESSTAVVDSTFSGNRAASGGALYIIADRGGLVQRCTFAANRAEDGAGVALDVLAEPMIDDCCFERNVAENEGGAIWCRLASPTIKQCSFTANEAGYGGGVHSSLATLTVRGSYFNENVSVVFGPGIRAEAGSFVMVEDTEFRAGMAIFQDGGAISVDESELVVVNSHFEDNAEGAASGNSSSHSRYVSCSFVNNADQSHAALVGGHQKIEACTFIEPGGGAIRATGNGSLEVTDCLFDHTATAIATYGPIRVERCEFLYCGRGIDGLNGNADVQAIDCVFRYGFAAITGDHNRTRLVNCVLGAANRGFVLDDAEVELTGCVMSGLGMVFDSDDSIATARSCTIFANVEPVAISLMRMTNCIVQYTTLSALHSDWRLDYCNRLWGGEGEGNFVGDPGLVDPWGPDGAAGTGDEDWRLRSGSPCIDRGWTNGAGLDALDLDGDGVTDELVPFDAIGTPRFVDDASVRDEHCGLLPIDVGAREFLGGFAATPRYADIDGDGAVATSDLIALLGDWGEFSCFADVNADATVDFDDLLIVIGEFDGR